MNRNRMMKTLQDHIQNIYYEKDIQEDKYSFDCLHLNRQKGLYRHY